MWDVKAAPTSTSAEWSGWLKWSADESAGESMQYFITLWDWLAGVTDALTDRVTRWGLRITDVTAASDKGRQMKPYSRSSEKRNFLFGKRTDDSNVLALRYPVCRLDWPSNDRGHSWHCRKLTADPATMAARTGNPAKAYQGWKRLYVCI